MKAKRIASVFVAAVLVLGLLPSVALANGSDDVGVGDVDSAASSPDVFTSAHQASDVAGMSALESTPAPLATTTASGTMGTCTWTLAGGVLTIAPTDGVSGEFNGYSYFSPWYDYASSIASVVVEPGVSAKGTLQYMFRSCTSLVIVDLSNLNMTGVTDMSYMFYRCESLQSVDFSGFDFSLVSDMSYMFYYCSSLKSVNFSGADLSSVINMSQMFNGLGISLQSVDFSGADLSSVINMSQMFTNCSLLESVDFSDVNSSLVTNMSSMFSGCSSLSYLDLSGFTTSSLTNMSSMYSSRTALRTVIVGDGFVFNTVLPTPTMTVTSDGRTTTAYGWWVSDSGIVYDDPADIPSNVAATYTAAFPADKTELEMTIKAVAQLDESEYTPDSWAVLQDVLQAAQSIDADNTATQAEVNEVTDALLAAIDALQKLFVDVSDPNTYYYEYVYYMAELGLITGYNETTFGVGDPMTRAQLVTIMWRYCEPDEYANYNEAAAKNTSGLPDVADGMYYTGAVNWAVSEGVVTGNQLADGSYVFSPDDNVSFEQMVTIVARYVLGFDGAEKYDTSALTKGAFTDAATVSGYARGSVAWAIENGVVTGNQNSNGTYTIAPLENVARERAATVLARAIQEGLVTAN